MPITDKNRKILWARSGNRCAMCRTPLVIEKTDQDDESVIAAECHIISSSPSGPRHDPLYPETQLDSLENFILLCATHHKMIDDQQDTYTAEIIRSIKNNHEKWVETKLNEALCPPSARIRRFKQNVPKNLPRITSGQELLVLTDQSCAYSLRHDDGLSESETELVARFAQEISDWIDIASDLEAYDRVRYSSQVQESLDELGRYGFCVFAAKETQQLEGGNGAPSAWPVLHLCILRSINPDIQTVSPQL